MRRGFWLWFVASLLRPILLMLTRRDWRGQENIPASGPAILAVNHLSYVDPLIAVHFVYDRPREIRTLAKAGLFDLPVVGFLLRRAGQIPVHRTLRDGGNALVAAIDAVRSGQAVIIYPEGTCTRDPGLWPMRGRSGVARLWLATGAPVIPIAQWGAQRIHHPLTGKLRLRPRTPVSVSAGSPVDLSAFTGAAPTGENFRRITEVVMRRLRDDVAVLRGEPSPTGPLHVPTDRQEVLP